MHVFLFDLYIWLYRSLYAMRKIGIFLESSTMFAPILRTVGMFCGVDHALMLIVHHIWRPTLVHGDIGSDIGISEAIHVWHI